MSDPATQLVRAYLHVNGYFTATEYRLVEKSHGAAQRSATDIDLLAIRFGHRTADAVAPGGRDRPIVGPLAQAVDPVLSCDDQATDVIPGEIKQGQAHLNASHRIRMVLFASRGEHKPHGWHLVNIGHLLRFLQDYSRPEGAALSVSQLLDSPLGWLAPPNKCDLKLAPVAAQENSHDDQTHHGHRAGAVAETA